jgi:cell division septal protein FtsQ
MAVQIKLLAVRGGLPNDARVNHKPHHKRHHRISERNQAAIFVVIVVVAIVLGLLALFLWLTNSPKLIPT